MAEPVNIGGQIFIKTSDGWVDKKTKAKAPEGLVTLLNKLQSENSDESKKKRVRFDTTRKPVVFGGIEYAWDLESQRWLVKKTKEAANPRFSMMIEEVYQRIVEEDLPITKEEAKTVIDKSKAAATVSSSMGIVGEAGKRTTKRKTGTGVIPATPNKKINSPIVSMIEKLASIDGYLKQKLNNDKQVHTGNITAAKEAAIEQDTTVDAVPNIEESKSKKSNAAMIAAAVGLVGLLATQFEPLEEALGSIVDGVKSVFNFMSGAVDAINDTLKFFLDTDAVPPAGTVTFNSSTNRLEAAEGYRITQDSSGSQYVYSEGDTTAYRVNVNQTTQQATIDYSQTMNVGSQTSTVNATPASSSSSMAGSNPFTSTPSSTSSSSSMAGINPLTRGVTQNQQASPTNIPQNDIVALGNYLIGQGAERSKMQHPAFGPVGRHSRNSRHYRGMAIDVNFPGANEAAILDQLEPQLRAAGYYTLWRRPGHMTHMHVSVGGPEGSTGGEYAPSAMQQVGEFATEGLRVIGDFFRSAGTSLFGEREYQPMELQTANAADAIRNYQLQRITAVVDSRSQEPELIVPALPNINASNPQLPIQNPPTQDDRNETLHYVNRQSLAM